MHNKSDYGRTGSICYNKITVKCYKNGNREDTKKEDMINEIIIQMVRRR